MKPDPPKKKKRPMYPRGRIIEALKATRGRVYLAAKALGCQPVTIYRRAKTSSAIRAVINNFQGEFLDVAESALERAVINGEAWAVCFTLKCKGKERGYVERQQHEHGEPGQFEPVNVAEVLEEIGDRYAGLEDRSRQLAIAHDASRVGADGVGGGVADAPPPGSNGRGHNGHAPGSNGKRPGH